MKHIKLKYAGTMLLCLILFLISAGNVSAQQKKKVVVKPPPPPNNIKLGEDAFLKQDYPSALIYLEKAVVEFPDSVMGIFYLANTYLKLGDYENGMRTYRKASEMNDKIKDSFRKLNFYDIPLPLFKPNFDGHELITRVANGIRVSAGIYQEKASAKILNDLAYPVWAEAGVVVGYGVEVGGFYNPASISIGCSMGEVDLKTVKQRFALPPIIPDEHYSGYDYKVLVNSINANLLYTPAVCAFGFLYPSVGGCFVYSTYKHGSLKQSNISFGLAAELMVKYKNIFIKGSYKKAIDDKTFDSQLALQFGFKINMFNGPEIK